MPRSRTIFHFTKSRETLKLILSSGFWPRYCSEDTRWIGQADAPTVAFPMVCFCDIPLSRISDHVKFYGHFGLGMTREWATANSLNPILYVAGENPVSTELKALNAHANKLSKEDKIAAKASIRYLYAHIKPSRGIMTVDGAPIEKDFYLESEWRHVPKNKNVTPFLLTNKFTDIDKLAIENQKTYQYCRLKFTPKDIKYIFVRSDADIPDLINFIQGELDNFPHADTKVLMSRVTSLESIQSDV